jgi:hypothetical protein
MSSAAAESNPPLSDRNAAKPEGSTNKEGTAAAATRPPPSRLRKNAATEKENQLQ